MECGESGEVALEECDESGEGALVNAYRYSEKLGVQYGPTAAGRRSVLPPILKNEVGISRCARARLMAFTLLLHKLKPQKERAAIGHVLLYSHVPPTH